MHEELRRHYPVPKNLNEVEKQALTFHVVRLKEMLIKSVKVVVDKVMVMKVLEVEEVVVKVEGGTDF